MAMRIVFLDQQSWQPPAGAALPIDDLAAAVELERAAIAQRLLEALAAALHARLDGRHRQAEAVGEVLLADALVLGQQHGLPLLGRQGVHEGAERRQQAFAGQAAAVRAFVVAGELLVGGRLGGLAPVVVDDRVPGDAQHPGVQRSRRRSLLQLRRQLRQRVLDEILGGVRVLDPAPHVTAQVVEQFGPGLGGVRGGHGAIRASSP